jgi:hypothetical protein
MKKDTSLEFLYSFLKGFHLSNSLVLIAAINSALKYDLKNIENEGVAPYVIDWLNANCKTRQNFLTIFIDTGRLARYLLLSGANDYRNKSLDLRNDSFAIALNMTGAVYDTDLEKRLFREQGAAGILARMSQKQFPLQADYKDIIGRGYLLFVQLAENFKNEYSFEEKMNEYFGIGAFEFIATGMTLWMKTNGYESNLLEIHIPAMVSVASDHNQTLFLKLSSGTPEDYRRFVRGDNWKALDEMKDTYGAEPFFRIPALLINHSTIYKSGSFVIPQPKYFFDRASSGIFYLLADREQQIATQLGKRGQNPFRKEFGHIYRKYAGTQLNQGNGGFQFIDMDEDYDNKGGISIPDFAFVKNEICVLFEIKTTLLKVEARSYFEQSTLSAEIKDGSFKKALKQLYNFGEFVLGGRIDDVRFKNISRVIKVIIGYEDVFVLNTLLLPVIQAEYGEMANDLQLGSVSDLELMGTMISQDLDFVQMLTNKSDHPDERFFSFMGLWQSLTKKNNPILSKSFDNFMNRMMGSSGITSQMINKITV